MTKSPKFFSTCFCSGCAPKMSSFRVRAFAAVWLSRVSWAFENILGDFSGKLSSTLLPPLSRRSNSTLSWFHFGGRRSKIKFGPSQIWSWGGRICGIFQDFRHRNSNFSRSRLRRSRTRIRFWSGCAPKICHFLVRDIAAFCPKIWFSRFAPSALANYEFFFGRKARQK